MALFLNKMLLHLAIILLASGAFAHRAGPEDELIGYLPEFQCPSPGGAFPWLVCDKYVLCESNRGALYQCKFNYYFDLVYSGCNYPEQVDCGNRTLPDGSTQAPTTTTTKSPLPPFECPGLNGNYPNPYDCASYYLCSNGYPFLILCPGDLFYNAETGVCDYPENVDCSRVSTLEPENPNPTTNGSIQTSEIITGPGPNTTEATPPLVTTSNEPFVCPGDGVFPHADCSKFYQCANGEAIEQSCPGGLTFNPDLKACDFPENFLPPCGTRFPCPTPDGYFANPDDCSSYFVCSAGLSYKQSCSPGLVFNEAIGVCDFPFNVPPPCGTLEGRRAFAEGDSTLDPTTGPTPVWWFDCSTQSGLFPNPEDCSSYINCDNGNAWLQFCPNGTLFEAQNKTCGIDVDCTASTWIRTSPILETVTPDPNYQCPEANGLFPNPLDCGTFYQCANSMPILLYCPGNLHFSAELQQCVAPEEANCEL